ncbi:hypothetical protein Tco_1046646 [Tanacetum coccineum]
MENANPSSALGPLSQQPLATTHTDLMARVKKLLKIRQTIDSLLSKTINELTNQSSDSEIFCPRERIKELELRMQRRYNFEEEFFKDMFLIEEELAYHKELLVLLTASSEVVLGKPFVQAFKLTYDESLGLISTWMAFGGNTRYLGSFREEMDKTTTLHQILKEVVHIEYGDDVASFKRRRQEV